MKSIIKSAKTVDEAIEIGLKEIGLTRHEVEIEIIQEHSKGILGLFGGNDAIVKIKEKTKMKIDIDEIFEDSKLKFDNTFAETVEDDIDNFEDEDDYEDIQDEDFYLEYDLDEEDEDSEDEKKEEITRQINTDVTIKSDELKEDFEQHQDEEDDEELTEIKEFSEVLEVDFEDEDDYDYENDEEAKIYSSDDEKLVNTRELDFSGNANIVEDEDDIEETAKKIKSNLEDILVKMHIDSKVSYETEKDNIIKLNLTDISENDTGIVIGSKGETLNAIQYILSLLTNKNTNKYYRVTLNVANYRDRKKKSIEINAQKVAYKVLKTKKSIALRPMNSYERRIVHYSLQNYKGIETVSIGKFPNRKVVIKYQEK